MYVLKHALTGDYFARWTDLGPWFDELGWAVKFDTWAEAVRYQATHHVFSDCSIEELA
jgi:hypothetical protein